MRIEPLGNGVEVFVSDRHHFTTDTVLLANFANAKNGEKIVELGTGCGTIPLLIIRDTTPDIIHAVEIQEEAIDLLRESVTHNTQNGIPNAALIDPIRGDIREIKTLRANFSKLDEEVASVMRNK